MKESKRPKFGAVLALWTLVLVAPHANASEGGNGSGGGKGIVCTDSAGEQKYYLADTFKLGYTGALDSISSENYDAVVPSIASTINKLSPAKIYQHPYFKNQKVSLGFLLLHKFNTLQFEASESPLQDLPDDNIDENQLPANCKKFQLAIQNFKTGVVQMDWDKFLKLSNIDKGFLQLHEALIALRAQPGADTTPIRAEVDSMARTLLRPDLTISQIARSYLQYVNLPNAKHGDGLKEDINRSVKTILKMPSKLVCKTTWYSLNELRWTKPKFITIKRVRGDGLPNSENSYYDINAVPTLRESVQVFGRFNTNRHMEIYSPTPIGAFDFMAVIDHGHNKNIILHLYSYTRLTNEFKGHVLYELKDLGPNNVQKRSGGGIVCSGEMPEFGIDLKHSFDNN